MRWRRRDAKIAPKYYTVRTATDRQAGPRETLEIVPRGSWRGGVGEGEQAGTSRLVVRTGVPKADSRYSRVCMTNARTTAADADDAWDKDLYDDADPDLNAPAPAPVAANEDEEAEEDGGEPVFARFFCCCGCCGGGWCGC